MPVVFRGGPLAAVLVPLLGCGPSAGTASSPAPSGATASAITAADLRGRLYAYADDSMQGRRSGTPGNVKATDVIAAEVRRIGLEPAGEEGGWFQTVPIVRRTIDPASALIVDGATFRPWDDLVPRDQGKGTRSADGARAVYGGEWDRIPITFFTTGNHPDYHQLTDEPQYIDYDKLARVTRLIGDVAAAVADLAR